MDQFIPAPAGHGISVLAILLAWFGVLSPVLASMATLVALLYYILNIYSMPPIQAYLKRKRRRRMQRLERELAALKERHHEED